MKNKLIDLNNHLFAQMERLSEENIDKKKLEDELARTKAISMVAGHIISNARLALDAKVAIRENMMKEVPGMIGFDGYDEKE